MIVSPKLQNLGNSLCKKKKKKKTPLSIKFQKLLKLVKTLKISM